MKVLFVNLLMIGDVINSAHIAKTLSMQKDDVRVDLLTYSDNQGVSEVCSYFNEKIYLNRNRILSKMHDSDSSIVDKYKCLNDEIYPILEKEYDVVYNLTHNKISSIICSMVKANKKPGIVLEDDKKLQIRGDNNWLRYFNDFVATDTFNTFQYVDVLRKAIELPCGETGSDIIANAHYSEEHPFGGEKFFIVKPTTSEVSKNWNIEDYIETVNLLLENQELNCLVLGTPDERVVLEEIKNGVGRRTKIGIFSFEDLPEIIGLSEFIVGGDTGILHMASAMHVKTITISCGPGTYYKSTPYGEGNIIFYPKMSCYPCEHLTDCKINHKCRGNIRPQDVVEAITIGCVQSSQCGVLRTFFDENGFLSYENINTGYKDKEFFRMLSNRKVVIEYMSENIEKDEYSFDELKTKLMAGA